MKRKLLLVITAILFCSALSAQTYHFPEPNQQGFEIQNSTIFHRGTVSVDGVVQTNSNIEIAVFANSIISDRCFLRATDGYFFLTCYGNAVGETITFKMYNHETGEGDDYTCNTTYTFSGQESTVTYPVIEFTSNNSSEDDEIPYPWPDPITDEDHTDMVCQIQLNGVPVTENNRWDLGVFIGTTCIAHRSDYSTPPPALSPNPVWNLVIYGHQYEEAYFLIYDITNSRYFQGTCDYTQTLDYDAHGNVKNPVVLNFIAPYVFEGTADTSWDTENNWKEPAVGLPSETDEVTINGVCELSQNTTVKNITVNEGKCLKVMSGTTLTLTDGFTATDASQFVLVDDAQLIDATLTAGPASYMKTVQSWNTNDNNWYLIGSPVGNATISTTDFPTTESDYDLYWYDETNQTHEEWRNYKNHQDGSFIPGVGYLYANEADCTPSMPGTINYNPVSVEMTFTDRTYDDLDGLNLLANPFPYAITLGNLDNYSNDKTTDGFYLLENGAWSSQSSDATIATGQAFLLGCTEGITVTFNPNASSKRGNAEKTSIKVNIANSNYADHAFIILNEGNDLVKVGHRNNQIPEVSIPKDNKSFAIAHFNREAESVIVAYNPKQFGEQTLNVELKGSFEYLTLKDNVTGAIVDLLANPTYTFNARPNDTASRFTFSFKANTNVNEDAMVNPINYFGRELNINGLEGESELQVVDMLGRMVSTATINGNYKGTVNAAPGVYVIRLLNNNNTYTEKIVVE